MLELFLSHLLHQSSSMGKLKFPYLPIDLILNDKFDSINKTSNINIPSLVLHGKDDNLVPFYMGQEIFASLTYKSRVTFCQMMII